MGLHLWPFIYMDYFIFKATLRGKHGSYLLIFILEETRAQSLALSSMFLATKLNWLYTLFELSVLFVHLTWENCHDFDNCYFFLYAKFLIHLNFQIHILIALRHIASRPFSICCCVFMKKICRNFFFIPFTFLRRKYEILDNLLQVIKVLN